MADIITLGLPQSDCASPLNLRPTEQPAFLEFLLGSFSQGGQCLKLPPTISPISKRYVCFASSNLPYPTTMHITHNPYDCTLKFRFCFLRNGQLLTVSSSKNREILCKALQKLNYRIAQQNLHFAVNLHTGLLQAKHSRLLITHATTLHKEIRRIVHLLFGVVDCHLLPLLKFVNQARDCDLLRKNWRYENLILAQSQKIMQIRELIAISHLNLGETLTANEKQFQEKQVQQFTQYSNRGHAPISKQSALFCHWPEKSYLVTRKLTAEGLLSGDFTKQFENYFSRFSPKNFPNGENAFLFNTVFVKNQERVQTTRINSEGGSSIIVVAQIQIAQIGSQNPVYEPPPCTKSLKPRAKNQSKKQILAYQQSQRLEYITKTIAIKTSKTACNLKIQHEKEIVKHLRTVCSPFFLKYYHSVQPHFPHRHHLMMDYLGQYYTLAQYTALHAHSLFLSSKMHFFAHLANALQLLQDLNITHMDLSTNNLIVTQDLMIKIIDFGQAYHPEVCQNNHNYSPGHSLPFSPPEVFNALKSFTPKSDVFSFGIILHRLTFGSHLFSPTPSLRHLYESKSYHSRMLLAPEGGEAYCNSDLISLILQLINRCLVVEVSQRPCAYWLYVILNKLLLLFNR